MTVLKKFDDDTQDWETIVVGKQGPGVPAGGTEGQLVAKAGTADYDTEWVSALDNIASVQFDVDAGLEPNGEGYVIWDDEAGTVDVGLDGGVTLHLGQEVLIRVSNKSGQNITKGTLLAYDGTVGQSGRLLVKKAVADGSDPAKLILGVAASDIDDDEDGFALQQGRVKPFNTTGTGWLAEDILWADPAVPGGLTRVEPAAPNLRFAVAVVVAAGSAGTLYVRVTAGSSLKDDDLVTLTDLQQGDTLLWDAGQGRFENGQPPTALVDSVNGQVGTVVLDAADVGAYADDNPSNFIDAAGAPVQSVNGAAGTVVLTAADVGAVGTAGGTATGKIVAPDFDYGVTTAGFDTVALDFSTGDGYLSRLVGGTAVVITGSGYTPGVTRTVRLVGGTVVASLSVPVDWKFVGSAAGTALGTAVTAIVTATSFGTAASDVVAAFAEQP